MSFPGRFEPIAILGDAILEHHLLPLFCIFGIAAWAWSIAADQAGKLFDRRGPEAAAERAAASLGPGPQYRSAALQRRIALSDGCGKLVTLEHLSTLMVRA